MVKLIINGQKVLRLKIITNTKVLSTSCLFLVSLNLFSSDPIAYLNTLGYEPAQKEIAYSKNGMVTTQHFLATSVGEKILNKGGNAYDASIAIAFTLAVVLPRAGNIGGGGFMVMYDKETEKPYSIDYREKAPAKSHQDMYLYDDGSFNKENFLLLDIFQAVCLEQLQAYGRFTKNLDHFHGRILLKMQFFMQKMVFT